MAAVLEQALTPQLGQVGAADREAAADLLGREPERIVHGGSGVEAAFGSGRGYRK